MLIVVARPPDDDLAATVDIVSELRGRLEQANCDIMYADVREDIASYMIVDATPGVARPHLMSEPQGGTQHTMRKTSNVGEDQKGPKMAKPGPALRTTGTETPWPGTKKGLNWRSALLLRSATAKKNQQVEAQRKGR